MFARLLSKPLQLEVDGQTLTFLTLADFEFALSCRTEVPGAKVSTLVQLPPEALAREAKSIRQVERVFVDVLTKSLEEPGAVGALLDSIELQSFSADHQWREIIVSLRRQESRFDEYKQAAIVKYMQYLAARQEVLRSIYQDKKQHEPVPEPEPGPESGPDNAPGAHLIETQLLDVRAVRDADLVRLPRGETVEVQCAPGAEFALLLSGHRFKLINHEPLTLVGTDGTEFPLNPGKNVVGRFHGNQIPVGSDYRDVSRKHLVIERSAADRIRLTDLSSHGTSVPRSAVSERLPW